jgi:hypothetical protein
MPLIAKASTILNPVSRTRIKGAHLNRLSSKTGVITISLKRSKKNLLLILAFFARILDIFLLSVCFKDFIIVFKDVRQFAAGGTLNNFTKSFGNQINRVKGFFLYELIKYDNNDEILHLNDSFEQNDFFSSISNSTISDEDYQIYLKDYTNFGSKKDYLLHYNEQDTIIMIDPINNLIDKYAKYGVDIMSFSSCSSKSAALKYALAYENFDINWNYSNH